MQDWETVEEQVARPARPFLARGTVKSREVPCGPENAGLGNVMKEENEVVFIFLLCNYSHIFYSIMLLKLPSEI